MRTLVNLALLFIASLLVASAVAQQASSAIPSNLTDSETQNGAGTPAIIQGQPNYIPLWLNTVAIGSSVMYQDPNTKNVGVSTKSPVATLDVNGNANVANTYKIGGGTVLGIGRPVDMNLFIGGGAGASNLPGQGVTNTFSGFNAGHLNDVGVDNTFSGANAGGYNTGGQKNTFTGSSAGLANNTGNNNVFTGSFAGTSNTTGSGNTFSGYSAGALNTNGDGNTFYGHEAGYNTTAGFNTFVGYQAGYSNTIGSGNVYIANQGPGTGTESGAIRIGDSTQTMAYVAGIYGVTASGGVQVFINLNGQLGTLPSSLRFKEQIRDMGDGTNDLMRLRPVTFRYKPNYDQGRRTLQYGLIAEEVAELYPELVAYDPDGKPYTVKYQYLTSMLLNEVQKQYHHAEAQAAVITKQQQRIESQQQQIDNLQKRMSQLELLIGSQVKTAESKWAATLDRHPPQ